MDSAFFTSKVILLRIFLPKLGRSFVIVSFFVKLENTLLLFTCKDTGWGGVGRD